MKALGITSGIGSMLVGARNAGFKIEGNIEWRRYYHIKDDQERNTFKMNFPTAIFQRNLLELDSEQLARLSSLDLALSHPECGNFSTLSATVQGSRSLQEMQKDAGDIPIFVEAIKKLKPRFFVQDNLPKSLIGYGIEKWQKNLPEYDLFPEWISNWGYGNTQKFRNRFFMIGALKSERFVFVPHEIDKEKTLQEILENLPEANNEKHTLEESMSKGHGIFSKDPMTWAQYKFFMDRSDEGTTIPYIAKDGTWKKHIGWRKGFKLGYVPVLTGGCPIANPFTGLPFSIRERCRIQGLPDGFIIYGTKLNPDGTWNHSKNGAVIKQTGKCMPVQFCEFVSEQIAEHINGIKAAYSGNRILKPNPYITEAKKWYCEHVGYSNQDAACDACWVKNC